MSKDKQIIIKPASISLSEQLDDVQKSGNALGLRCIKLEKANAELEKDKQRLQKANDELFGQMTEESDRADKAEEAKSELLAVIEFGFEEGIICDGRKEKMVCEHKTCMTANKAYNKHKGESE